MIERALRYNANEPAVDLVRARIQRDQRQFAAAIESLQRLQKALPDLEDTVPLLAENLRDLGYERMFAKDDLGAADAWVRCLQIAPGEFVTDAVRMQLQAIWRRQEKIGLEARKAGDEAAARAAFRMCLRIDPSQHWAAWLLVAGLVEDPDADLAEVDALSERALAGQRAKQLDASRQVGVRALALRRLGRSDEARVLLRDYLAAPDAEAPAEVLQVLSRMLEELSR
jgi:tetratricopeptide (TPR) repeat protein